ncbi:uncharacterized protein [Nicotiana sylvestris]|uniref:uncharacterized protein n=1 Tax=Nicotiana sylvestris TaxID=4096 RepID=UPI00388CCF16
MVGDDNIMDLAAKAAAQIREKVALDAEEVGIRDTEIAYEEERAHRMAQNQPLGKMNEDPNNHMMDFEEIMNTFQYNGVSQDAVYLRVFPFTLKDDAKHWIRSLPHGSIRTWEEMTRIFLAKYFSSAKTGKFRREIYNFYQNKTETVQLDAMTKEIRKLTLASIHNEPHAACNICGRGHPTNECHATIEEVNVVGNYNFNPRLQFQPQQSNQYGLEDLMKSFIVKTDERLDSHGAAIKELETGTLPADTEKNPKETVNDVTLRSEQVMKDSTPIQKEVAPEKENRKELKIEYDKKTEKKKAYAKFLKEILKKKRKIEEIKVVKFTEHCSAILQNKLPQKCGDPGSFTIPCSLGILNFDKYLCDSGASINLMPLSIYRNWKDKVGANIFVAGRPNNYNTLGMRVDKYLL